MVKEKKTKTVDKAVTFSQMLPQVIKYNSKCFLLPCHANSLKSKKKKVHLFSKTHPKHMIITAVLKNKKYEGSHQRCSVSHTPSSSKVQYTF